MTQPTTTRGSATSLRWTGLAIAALPLLLAGLAASAQNTLPPAQPTQIPAPAVQPAQPSIPRHTQVLYSAGVLTVHAENSSLNEILREVSHLTGMSITGGVREERVYGNYGPADTGTVLATLLAGTGSNMLLEESTADRPLTLVLTPRQGGPTPPSPASFAADQQDGRDPADLPPQQVRPTRPSASIPPANQAPPSAQIPSQQQPAQTSADTPATNTTTQQSPNGVRTPQQIYDQLMKLKQQQPAPQ